MEAAGLAVSLVSLAGLFQTAVDYFKYVQFGKNFGVDFQTNCLRLENTHLRLMRWGNAIGLGAETPGVPSLDKSNLREEDIKNAEKLLGHIVYLFRQAEEESDKMCTQHKNDEVGDAEEVLEGNHKSLHQQMRQICLRRQKAAGLGKKTSWALYRKERLERLVDDTRKLVDDLVESFPGAAAIYEQLCYDDAAQVHNEADLSILKDIAAKQDRALEVSIDRLRESRFQAVQNTWNNSDSTKVLNQVAGSQTFYGGQNWSL